MRFSVKYLPLLFFPLSAAVAFGQEAASAGLVRSGSAITLAPADEPGLDDVESMIRPSAGYRVFSSAEHALYARAFAAADRGDWKTARALAAQGGNPVVEKLMDWRYVTDRAGVASFAEIDGFLKINPTWPMRETLLARAEAKIDLDAPAAFVLGWYAGREPVSALGKICLGGAEIAAGKTATGIQHIRTGWMEGVFGQTMEERIVRKFSAYLTPDVDARRLDSLLWKDETAAARRQMARVDETTKAIAAARLAVKVNRKDADALIAALPGDNAGNAGLRFDQAHALRKAGDDAGARAILQGMSLAGLAREHPSALWVELAVAIRQALQTGDAKAAYALASGAGFLPASGGSEAVPGIGNEYSEAQFMAGWIALRVLREPQNALGHFRNFSNAVSRPISASRGAYWQGRAYEEMGDAAHAAAAYRAAADHSETFYGMLALTRIEAQPVLTARDTVVRPVPAGVFERDELVRAMQAAADLGQSGTLRRFALHYRATHSDPAQTKRLLQFLAETGYRPLVVRVAKAAGYEGHPFAAFAYPVIPVPAYTGAGTGPEEALVLALIRQETEFDVGAVSSTGARGLMQVIPSGGKGFAKAAGLSYRPADLTANPVYNMQLGMTMVADYLKRWSGSLMLGTAAYNAGPTNARRWVNAFGDPREAGVDPIDWIERIPFGETRNYVQRVIENLQVYRAVLAGGSAPLRIADDLYGDNPRPKPIRVHSGR